MTFINKLSKASCIKKGIKVQNLVVQNLLYILNLLNHQYHIKAENAKQNNCTAYKNNYSIYFIKLIIVH